MEDLQKKIAKLPTWAREHIRVLEAAAEPNNRELMMLRGKVSMAEKNVAKFRDQVDAMTEIFRCAARGGSETAKAYIDKVLADYEIDTTSQPKLAYPQR